jgi:hypothetical protein
VVEVAIIGDDGEFHGKLAIAFPLGISDEDLSLCLRAAAEGIRKRLTDTRIVVPLN